MHNSLSGAGGEEWASSHGVPAATAGGSVKNRQLDHLVVAPLHLICGSSSSEDGQVITSPVGAADFASAAASVGAAGRINAVVSLRLYRGCY